MKKFRLPCPSTCYAALTSQIPNFGEKSCKCFIQRQLLSVGIRSLLSAMYWKSSKVRIFWISLQIYLRELLPSNSYVLEMEETDIFRCFQRNFFLRLIATGEAGILLSSYLLWTTATQNHGRICKFVPLLTAMYLKEEKIPISSCFSEKLSEALCYLRNPIPSGSFVSKKAVFPNFAQVFVKKSIKKSPRPGNPR